VGLGAKLATEFVGTLVFLSVIALSGPTGMLAAIAIGSALMVMVYMGGHVSGAHYNPAVSLGVFLRGKLPLTNLLAYWAVQLLAGIAAFAFGWAVSGHTPGIHPGAHSSWVAALVVEIFYTAALVLVVLNVAATEATRGNSFYGLAIGFTIAAAVFAGGPISGGVFNPAVGFGGIFAAALFAHGGWGYLWIYLVGPPIGGAIAAALHALQVVGMAAAARPPQGVPSPGAPPPVP
jgi:aquaporin Z